MMRLVVYSRSMTHTGWYMHGEPLPLPKPGQLPAPSSSQADSLARPLPMVMPPRCSGIQIK